MLKIVQELKLLLEENPPLFSSKEDFLYFTSKKEAIVSNLPSLIPPLERAIPKPAVFLQEETKQILSLETHRTPFFIEKKKEEEIVPIVEEKAKEPFSNEKKREEKVSPNFTLGFSQIRKMVQKIDPHLPILDQIPNDAIAKKIANRWKTKNQAAPFSILSAFETKEQKRFLESIATALDVYFSPSKLIDAEAIEKENQWESFLSTEELKMIIISDAALWQLPRLKAFYKEQPAQGSRFLQKVPLFLLPDISLYFKDPRLKRSLWNSLCQKCLLK